MEGMKYNLSLNFDVKRWEYLVKSILVEGGPLVKLIF